MAIESITKKYISWSIAGIVILALAVTVILQNRRINSLLNDTNNSYAQEDAEKYQSEISKLKSQIADMQAWQDYLEDALNKKGDTAASTPQNRPGANRLADNATDTANTPLRRNGMRSPVSFRYDAMAEEIGLSEETKSKLMGLLDEMRTEIMNNMPGRGDGPPEMIDREAIRQQIEEISSKYNEKISEILTPDELDAFREYQNSESERMLIMGFNYTFDADNPLEKDTEKELVTALYNARQSNPDTKIESDSVSLLGGPFGRGPMNGMTENSDTLNSTYIEAARDILSEDEMQKFEEYINSGQSRFMRGGPGRGRFQGPE